MLEPGKTYTVNLTLNPHGAEDAVIFLLILFGMLAATVGIIYLIDCWKQKRAVNSLPR